MLSASLEPPVSLALLAPACNGLRRAGYDS